MRSRDAVPRNRKGIPDEANSRVLEFVLSCRCHDGKLRLNSYGLGGSPESRQVVPPLVRDVGSVSEAEEYES